MLVELLDSANETIDIGTPGFSSWSRCTPYAKENDTCTQACTPSKMRAEAFPIFPALLNAVRRGVKVRSRPPSHLRAAPTALVRACRAG